MTPQNVLYAEREGGTETEREREENEKRKKGNEKSAHFSPVFPAFFICPLTDSTGVVGTG